MHRQVLIVHPDSSFRQQLRDSLQTLGYAAETAASIAKARERCLAHPSTSPGLVILHISDQDVAGAFIEELRQLPSPLPVLASVNAQNLSAAAPAMRAGAMDFIVLPASPERLQATISNALKISALQHKVSRLSHRSQAQLTHAGIVATSPGMQRALDLARRGAANDLPILLEGEKGAGKEIVARIIHQQSPYANGPFVKIHICAESGLTDADDAHLRNFASKAGEAASGFLYIDDIAEAPPAFQNFLISLFNAKSGHRPRVICATRGDLIMAVKSGQFIDKLFYRLNVFPIQIPPLRERGEDFGEIVKNLAYQYSAEQGKSVGSVDSAAMRMLKLYPWPGNLTQLENTLYRAVALADGMTLTVKEFPQIAARVTGYNVEIPPEPAAIARAHYTGPAMIGSETTSPG
ncbi:MAG: sigma-54-dependent Fis family transcriptional regulator, partial [Chitinophagales bacterium]|nr:sigma-54-dependent Fis family transcriptional regulator [Hyphomicrobiales bacterium]